MTKKKKILWGSLILFGIVVVTMTVSLPIVMCNKSKTEEFVFNSPEEIEEYLVAHKQIHLTAPNQFPSNESNDFIDWIWDKKNYSIQNALNGALYIIAFLFWSPMGINKLSMKIDNDMWQFYFECQPASNFNQASMTYQKKGNNGNVIFNYAAPAHESIGTETRTKEDIDGVVQDDFGSGSIWVIDGIFNSTFSFVGICLGDEYPNLMSSFNTYYPILGPT